MPNRNRNKILVQAVFALSLLLNLATGVYIYNITRRPTDINILEKYAIPALLTYYRDRDFGNTFSPKKSPFGGKLYEYTEITTPYLDPSYYTQFGFPHYAIDIIPSQEYYKNSGAYKRSRRPVVMATHNGTVRYLVDENGANYIVVTNISDNVRTLYVHVEASYVSTGQNVVAGQPIGIMGNTGYTTGSHLHYAVQIKDNNGTWTNVNPQSYITE